MDKGKLVLLVVLVVVAVSVCLVLWLLGAIGAVSLTNGCFYRYNINQDMTLSSADKLTNTVTLKANANYTALTSEEDDSQLVLDPSSYGKWLNTDLRVKPGQKISFVVKGNVSLCKAYVPSYNIQNISNLDSAGSLIEIPRTEDKVTPPVNLIFDAKTGDWRNITQLFKNDHIVVSLYKDKKTTSSTSSMYDSVQKANITADCREGAKSYSPICGRYSIWDSNAPYVDKCQYVSQCYKCNFRQECKGFDIFGLCVGGYETVWDWCSCYENVYGTAPEPYANDGKYTAPWSDNINSLFTNFNRDCRTERSYVDGSYQNEKYFWFSADDATGLLYRFDNNLEPTSKESRGNIYAFAKIQEDQSYLNGGESYQIIMDEIYTASDVGYLQYRLHDNDGEFTDNTGGYVLNIKHTKCRRSNGTAYNDTMEGRGRIEYVITGYDKNPNVTTGNSVSSILLDANGSGSITASGNQEGILWLKIRNNNVDYKDSFGEYQVQFFTEVEKGDFYTYVLDPLLQGFKGKVQGAAASIFQNMTCYHGMGDNENCTNFLNYVKAILILYIMLYGMMFLLGVVKITQTDLIMRIIKISFVAGLLNGSTFDFFNNYVFGFVTNFSDAIISNMSGYSLFSGSTTISNPLMFMNTVMTRILMSPTFSAQMMAMLSLGFYGPMYFVIIFVCIGIVLIVLLRSIAVYLMAFMAIAVLMGLAPIFLTFILFDRTRYLFDNWVKFTFRYLIEPVVLLAGVIIITQLITIYLDYAVGYSVCWKCALSFKIPFPKIEGITPAFLDVESFCINWFSPWGFDSKSAQIGLSMQNLMVLLILAYCLWGYMEFSAKIVGRIAGGVGGPSATSMGMTMAKKLEDKALKQVGLDSESRAEMKKLIKSKLKSAFKGEKNLSLPSGNRHDIKQNVGQRKSDSKTSTKIDSSLVEGIKSDSAKGKSNKEIGSHRGTGTPWSSGKKPDLPTGKSNKEIGSHRGTGTTWTSGEKPGLPTGKSNKEIGSHRGTGTPWTSGKKPDLPTGKDDDEKEDK